MQCRHDVRGAAADERAQRGKSSQAQPFEPGRLMDHGVAMISVRLAGVQGMPSAPTPLPRFEYNLLRLLRFLLGHLPVEQAEPLLFQRVLPLPLCISPTAAQLVADTLAKGLVLSLVRSGGWRRDSYLHRGESRTGRLWERHDVSEYALELSANPLSFLIWLTAERLDTPQRPWEPREGESTGGDEFFFALAYDRLRQIPAVKPHLPSHPAFRGNALCWLMYPGDFAALADSTTPDFTPWFQTPRVVILEAWQPVLLQTWLKSERAKCQQEDWQMMRQQGQAEQSVLDAYLRAAHQAQRPELARFLLRLAAAIFTSTKIGSDFWTGGLRATRPLRLSDRLATQTAALSVPRAILRLQDWERQARSVGYFDEGYVVSQFWKSEWAATDGDRLAQQCQAVLDSLDPLRFRHDVNDADEP